LKALFTIGLIVASFYLSAQRLDTIQEDILLSKLQQTNELQKTIEIDEIKGVYKLSVWHFVPNLNYDFINNNYYLTISSSGFVTNMLSRRQEEKKIKAIERRYEQKIQLSQLELKGLLLALNDNFDNLKASGLILYNDLEIYKIKQQENEANEIDTETYLKEKSLMLTKIKTHNNLLSEIRRQLLEIEKLTATEININLSPYYVPLNQIDHE
jgi:hypothetical protein